VRRSPLVLVADDNPDILKLVSRRLERRGYSVTTATNGREALEAARSIGPDAAVLDWVMPHLQGHEVCAQLKAEGNELPVILLTARATEDDIIDGFESGADEYLTKPFDIDELDEALRRLLAVPA